MLIYGLFIGVCFLIGYIGRAISYGIVAWMVPIILLGVIAYAVLGHRVVESAGRGIAGFLGMILRGVFGGITHFLFGRNTPSGYVRSIWLRGIVSLYGALNRVLPRWAAIILMIVII